MKLFVRLSSISQVKEFVITLSTILQNDEECRDKYKLILCGDVYSQKLSKIVRKAIIDDSVNQQFFNEADESFTNIPGNYFLVRFRILCSVIEVAAVNLSRADAVYTQAMEEVKSSPASPS